MATSGPPAFSTDIRFSPIADPADGGGVFPSGTKEVFALWTYTNMSPGLVVRREWDLNGEAWLVREEPWDFARYGADGTVDDVSVYDLDYGLLPGVYDVRLSIEGVPQSQGRFVIAAWGTEAARSPDGRRIAQIKQPGTLVVQEADGSRREFEVAREIADLAWFPDSRHIVFSEYDRSEQIPGGGTAGLMYDLWLFDPTTEEKTRLAGGDLSLHRPFPSPDGRYLAALGGSGWGDACLFDLRLVVLRLSPSLRPNEVYTLDDFAGIPAASPNDLAAIFPQDVYWSGPAELQADLFPICLDDLEEGTYRLDLNARIAQKIAEEPTRTPLRTPGPTATAVSTGTGTPTPP